MNFEYYYGTQADQFSFIRIPRILLLDEAFSALSLSAKVLYSVLLDRMGLSMKNKWLDEENKVYIIYQITEIQSDLGFSKKKAMDYLTELEKIGLIVRESVPEDARLKRIVLTEKAISLHNDVEKECQFFESVLTAEISMEDLEQFQKTLQVMCKNLTDYESKGGNSTC